MRDETLQIRKLWLGRLMNRFADGNITTTIRLARSSALASSSKLGAGRNHFEAS